MQCPQIASASRRLTSFYFFYEWNDQADGNGQWYRSYGLEVWDECLKAAQAFMFCHRTGRSPTLV
jgi:nuclear transport factor 2 (NTF2) superfamily protein